MITKVYESEMGNLYIAYGDAEKFSVYVYCTKGEEGWNLSPATKSTWEEVLKREGFPKIVPEKLLTHQNSKVRDLIRRLVKDKNNPGPNFVKTND